VIQVVSFGESLHRPAWLSTLLCANLATGFYKFSYTELSMAAAKKSSRRSSGRKRSRSKSSGRKSGRRKVAGRKRSSARKSSRRKGGRKASSSRKSARKSSSRKKSSRGRSRRRTQSPVARVKRVATGVVQQAAGLGERAVDTVTEFVQDRF
jgi:hypothetical protein